METTTDAGSVASSTELLNPCSTPLVGCGMVNASDRAGFRGRLQSRIVRRGDPHELRNRPLDTQSLINGTAHEPLQLHPDARRDARRLSCRGSGLWGYGLEEGGYVAQVYVSLVRFFQPQKRLISEEHVGLFPGEPTGSSGLEAFSDQARVLSCSIARRMKVMLSASCGASGFTSQTVVIASIVESIATQLRTPRPTKPPV